MEKRILLDTSVYGEFVDDREFFYILKQKIRTYLLYFYDQLITKENHVLKVNFLVESLAQKYYSEYRKRGGGIGEENIRNDSLIVASATLYQMAILVSSDKRTLLSDHALKAYKHVNDINGLKSPEYLNYKAFRNKLFKRCDIS